MQIFAELTRPTPVVVPLTLYSKPSTMRDWLKHYKPGSEEHDSSFAAVLEALVWRFMAENGETLFQLLGGWDKVSVVPSSSRMPPHPLTALIANSDAMRAPLIEPLERGLGELGHRITSDHAYVVRGSVEGQRILLVDDVFTTGAHAQSAASALQNHGAVVPAIFVLARRINPSFNQTSEQVWLRQRDQPYDYRQAISWLLRRDEGSTE
ncbi:ComF family protein [Nonomuraea fuscirosea]|uniref:ComF family protein n=1 Tax=Nonomuraea fuscirosea TaxID=1291556 RepID=UPI003424F3CD